MKKKSMEVEEKVVMDTDYADDVAIRDNSRDDLQESTDLLAEDQCQKDSAHGC
jgi:hypothetical protein